MEPVTARAVQAELQRVAADLEEAEALVDAAARQVGGVVHLRQRLETARRLLGTAGVVVGHARRFERSDDVSVARTFAWSLPLPFAFAAAGLAVDQAWWVVVAAWVGVYAAVAVAGHAFTGTVLRAAVHRRASRRSSPPEVPPSCAEVPADDLTSSSSEYWRAQLLMRSRSRRAPRWRARSRLGRAAATLVGVPGAGYLPASRRGVVLPAVQRLVCDVDVLVHDLDRRPFARRSAAYGIEHYLRARAILVHTHRHLTATTTAILDTGETVTPRQEAA